MRALQATWQEGAHLQQRAQRGSHLLGGLGVPGCGRRQAQPLRLGGRMRQRGQLPQLLPQRQQLGVRLGRLRLHPRARSGASQICMLGPQAQAQRPSCSRDATSGVRLGRLRPHPRACSAGLGLGRGLGTSAPALRRAHVQRSPRRLLQSQRSLVHCTEHGCPAGCSRPSLERTAGAHRRRGCRGRLYSSQPLPQLLHLAGVLLRQGLHDRTIRQQGADVPAALVPWQHTQL